MGQCVSRHAVSACDIGPVATSAGRGAAPRQPAAGASRHDGVVGSLAAVASVDEHGGDLPQWWPSSRTVGVGVTSPGAPGTGPRLSTMPRTTSAHAQLEAARRTQPACRVTPRSALAPTDAAGAVSVKDDVVGVATAAVTLAVEGCAAPAVSLAFPANAPGSAKRRWIADTMWAPGPVCAHCDAPVSDKSSRKGRCRQCAGDLGGGGMSVAGASSPVVGSPGGRSTTNQQLRAMRLRCPTPHPHRATSSTSDGSYVSPTGEAMRLSRTAAASGIDADAFMLPAVGPLTGVAVTPKATVRHERTGPLYATSWETLAAIYSQRLGQSSDSFGSAVVTMHGAGDGSPGNLGGGYSDDDW